MFIANELRKKNIAEYLLYMWQMEDTVRAFDCSLQRIKREYIERFDYNDEQKEEDRYKPTLPRQVIVYRLKEPDHDEVVDE